MPSLVARSNHRGRCGDWRADQAIVDGFACRLNARAEDCIRSTTDAHIGRSRRLEYLVALTGRSREWLLTINALAGANRAESDVRVRCRDGQVEDDVHPVVGQQLGYSQGPNTLLLSSHRLGARGINVRGGH